MSNRLRIGILTVVLLGSVLALYISSTEDRECPPYFYTDKLTDYAATLELETTRLDDKGVIQYDYGEKYENAGWQYTPYQISSLGITAINSWCETGDTESLTIAKAQAKWLIDNIQYVENVNYPDGFGVWMYDFPNPVLHATGPWTSGLGNGYVMVFLIQMYKITNENIYKDTALDALDSFNARYEEGGVRSTPLEGDGYWYEEVAVPYGEPTYIFNGHILTIFALDYIANLLDTEKARFLTDKGATAIEDMYHYFDLTDRKRTLYSLYPPDNTRRVDHYAHRHHINAMYWLSTYREDDQYFDIAEKWASWMDESIRPPVFTSTATNR